MKLKLLTMKKSTKEAMFAKYKFWVSLSFVFSFLKRSLSFKPFFDIIKL